MKLSDQSHFVLDQLRLHPRSSVKELTSHMAAAGEAWLESRVRRTIVTLDKMGLVDRVGGTVAYRGNRFMKVYQVNDDAIAKLQADTQP